MVNKIKLHEQVAELLENVEIGIHDIVGLSGAALDITLEVCDWQKTPTDTSNSIEYKFKLMGESVPRSIEDWVYTIRIGDILDYKPFTYPKDNLYWMPYIVREQLIFELEFPGQAENDQVLNIEIRDVKKMWDNALKITYEEDGILRVFDVCISAPEEEEQELNKVDRSELLPFTRGSLAEGVEPEKSCERVRGFQRGCSLGTSG